MRKSEADILDTVIQWAIQRFSASVWAEVVVPGVGTADAVLYMAGSWYVMEGKASKLSYHLLTQCQRWRTLCASTMAVVPTASFTAEREIAIQHFSDNEVTVVFVGPNVWVVNRLPTGTANAIGDFCNDSNKYGGSFAKAGTAGGRRANAYSIMHAQIEDFIVQNEGCTAAAAARFANMRAPKLLKLIKDGQVRATVKTESGKSYLYAAGGSL